jgi:hypothetical protein
LLSALAKREDSHGLEAEQVGEPMKSLCALKDSELRL